MDVALADLFLQEPSAAHFQLPEPPPTACMLEASTTKSARVPTNSSQTSLYTTSNIFTHRATGREGPPRPPPPSHSMRPARGQTGPWPPHPLEGATARCSRFPRHRRTPCRTHQQHPTHLIHQRRAHQQSPQHQANLQPLSCRQQRHECQDSNAVPVRPRQRQLVAFRWPHPYDLVQGEARQPQQHGCGTKAPRPIALSRNILAGSRPQHRPARPMNQLRLRAPASQANDAARTPRPRTTLHRHQTNAISCSPYNKPAQPHSQAVDQWGSNDWPTVYHDNIAKRRRTGWIQRLVSRVWDEASWRMHMPASTMIASFSL